MKGKEFVEQDIADLNLSLFQLNNEEKIFAEMGLTIIKLQEFSHFGWPMCMAIIGESHFFWIKGLFMELLACTDLAGKGPSGTLLIKKIKGKNLDGFNYAMACNGLKYSVEVNFKIYSPEDANSPLPKKKKGKELFFLKENFPFPWENGYLPCKTEVRLLEINNHLSLDTSHAYPPRHIVLTRSTFIFG